MMSFSVATDNCGDYDYMLYEITPEKKVFILHLI